MTPIYSTMFTGPALLSVSLSSTRITAASVASWTAASMSRDVAAKPRKAAQQGKCKCQSKRKDPLLQVWLVRLIWRHATFAANFAKPATARFQNASSRALPQTRKIQMAITHPLFDEVIAWVNQLGPNALTDARKEYSKQQGHTVSRTSLKRGAQNGSKKSGTSGCR